MKQVLLILLTVMIVIAVALPGWVVPTSMAKEEVAFFEDEAIPLGDLNLFEANAFGLTSKWLEGVTLHALGADALNPGFTGQTRSQIEAVVGSPLTVYANTTISALNNKTRGYYAQGDDVLLVYYDNKKQGTALFTLQFNAEVARQTRFMTQPVYDNESLVQMTSDTVVLLNGVRQSYQRKPLKASKPLSAVAIKHSEDMVKNNYFSHTNSKGLGPKARIQGAKISFKAFGEALTAGSYTPVEALTAWLNSDGHRPIVLGDYNTAGLGIATGQTTYGIYYTLKVIRQ